MSLHDLKGHHNNLSAVLSTLPELSDAFIFTFKLEAHRLWPGVKQTQRLASSRYQLFDFRQALRKDVFGGGWWGRAMWWSGEMRGGLGLRGGEINPVWCQQQEHLCMSKGPRERYRTSKMSHDGSSVDVWVVMWLAVALDEQVVACATRGCTCKWMAECWLALLNTSAQFISLCDFYYTVAALGLCQNQIMWLKCFRKSKERNSTELPLIFIFSLAF